MDSVMFDAFNAHDLNALKNVFSPDLEFFHDRGGLSNYETSMKNFGGVFASVPDLHRELIAGTMEVYPIPGYGAVEMGLHRFIHKENGKDIVGLYKFTQIWQFKDGAWKVTREVSVGH
jgi:ketosteroid isomerase-like protein